jgi:hypothetical protein
MKLVALFLLSSFMVMSIVSAQEDTPFFLLFRHPKVDLTLQCKDVFFKVRDAIYTDYVNSLFATSTINETIASSIDAYWKSTTSTFTKVESTTATSSTRSSTSSANRRRKLPSCGGGVCQDSLAIIISRGCCDFCNKNCRRRLNAQEIPETNMFRRQLQESTLLSTAPIRDPVTGYIVVKNSGNSSAAVLSANTGLQGTSIADEFYATVRSSLAVNDPCRDMLLEAHYRVMAMEVIKL